MKTIAVIGLIIAVIFGLVIWLGYSSIEQPPQHESSQTEGTTKADNDSYPSVQTALKLGFIRLGSFVSTYREEIGAVGTIIVAFFTIVLAFATGFLYFATRDLVEGSTKTSRQQLRAYVYVQPGNVYLVTPNSKPQPRIIVRNSGQSFAKDVRCFYGAKIFPKLSLAESAALGTGEPEEGRFTLNPGVDHAIIKWMPSALADDDYTKIRTLSGDSRLYVFGRVEYKDAFAEPHFAEFCFMFYGEMQFWPDNGGWGFNSTQARYCENHNDAD
jgi:hypothetical protein